MTQPHQDPAAADRATAAEPVAPTNHPYLAEIEAERRGWYELVELVRELTPSECLEPGYYRDPDWTVRDLVAHIGTWLAKAEVELMQLGVGTYAGHDLDIDGLNREYLHAMHDQPWTIAWVQANSARTRMLQAWFELTVPSDEAAWWIRKSGPDHYHEHLDRLAAWVDELRGRRAADPAATDKPR